MPLPQQDEFGAVMKLQVRFGYIVSMPLPQQDEFGVWFWLKVTVCYQVSMPLPQQDEFGVVIFLKYMFYPKKSQCRFRSKMNSES